MALRQDGGSLELFCFRIVSPPHPSWQVFFLRNTLYLHIKGHYWRTIGDKNGEAGIGRREWRRSRKWGEKKKEVGQKGEKRRPKGSDKRAKCQAGGGGWGQRRLVMDHLSSAIWGGLVGFHVRSPIFMAQCQSQNTVSNL